MQTDSLSAMEELSVEDAVHLGAQDLTLFGKLFFPKTFRQESPDFHRIVGRQLYSRTRKNCFLIFRDGAKTSLLRVFVAQRVAYAISRTILFVSASQEHSIHSIRWIKRAIERNARYANTFALRPGSKWTDEWIEIENQIDGIPINILAAGITGQIRGFNLDDFRPDLIIGDDILTEETTKTAAQRQKIEELFHAGLVNSLQAESEAPHAKIVLLQTPFNSEDVAMKCVGDPSWNPLVFGILDENGESRWPQKFPVESIIEDRDSNFLQGRKRLWMREKMCKVVKSEDIALNSELLQTYTELPAGLINFAAIDPASSDKKKADNHVTLAIGVRGPDVYVRAYRSAKGVMPDKAASHFFEICAMNAPVLKAGCESIAYQRTLKWYIEQEMLARRIFVPMEMIQDKRSKVDRILQHIPGLLAYKHLHVHPSMTELIAEMDEYDPVVDDNQDDILDALAMAICLAGPILQSVYTLEGEARVLNDESAYPELTFNGGCP